MYRGCEPCPITERIKKAKWALFGHMPRMDSNTPVSAALHHTVETLHTLTGSISRPRTNLLSFLCVDLSLCGLGLRDLSDLEELKCLAYDCNTWRKMCVIKQYGQFYSYSCVFMLTSRRTYCLPRMLVINIYWGG